MVEDQPRLSTKGSSSSSSRRRRRRRRRKRKRRLLDEAGKRRLGKGAKPTVFFVAGIFALCRQDLFALLYLSALPLPCSSPPRRFPTSLHVTSYTLTTTTTTTTTKIIITTTVTASTISSTTKRLVVAAAYFSTHAESLARLEPLSADIYQHPRWRYNLTGFS